MNIIRCDRCGSEFEGEQWDIFFWFGRIHTSGYSWHGLESRQMEQHDFCWHCLEGLRKVMNECDRQIKKYMSKEFVKAEREFAWKWCGRGKELHPKENVILLNSGDTKDRTA